MAEALPRSVRGDHVVAQEGWIHGDAAPTEADRIGSKFRQIDEKTIFGPGHSFLVKPNFINEAID